MVLYHLAFEAFSFKVNDALLMISQVNWFGKLDNDHHFFILL